MAKLDNALGPRTSRQRAVLRIAAGRKIQIGVKIELTSGGLLALGGLVSSILLSTAVLVGASTRHLPKPDRR